MNAAVPDNVSTAGLLYPRSTSTRRRRRNDRWTRITYPTIPARNATAASTTSGKGMIGSSRPSIDYVPELLDQGRRRAETKRLSRTPSTRRSEARDTRGRSKRSSSSTIRTDDQTSYAVWWMEFAEGSVDRLARQLVTERNAHLWPAARLFASVGMALFDSYVAVWDAKYEYNHWRPYTAIREAEADDNPCTGADPNWEPLRTTPPFPEYVSGTRPPAPR